VARTRNALALVGLTAITASALAACGSTGKDASGGKTSGGPSTIAVKLTDKGCEPDSTTAAAGPIAFTVSNGGTTKVSEAEVVLGDRILGEKENITGDKTGTFSLSLDAGTYQLVCKGGDGAEKVDLVVSGGGPSPSPSATGAAALAQASTDYATYVKSQTAELITATKTFTDAVRAGDVTAAKAAYPLARVYYERIEPVAESFGDLDPDIDARVGDVESEDKWTGFHKIEKALWVGNTTSGMTPIADGLDTNVKKLDTLVQTLTYKPESIANGATELLDEVGKSKITGEEENYSHIDLVDFVGNVDGAEQAFAVLEPALGQINPMLAATIRSRFTALYAGLAAYKTGAAAIDYKNYADLTETQRKALATLVDALAEPLSTVAGTVVR
jgi:iron uptake system component EfeO